MRSKLLGCMLTPGVRCYGICAKRSLLRGGQQQRLLELDDLASARRIDDFYARQQPIPLLDRDFAWAMDQMIEPLKSHFDDIVFRVIDEANECDPIGLHLAAERKRPTSISTCEPESVFERWLKKGLHSAFSSFWAVRHLRGRAVFPMAALQGGFMLRKATTSPLCGQEIRHQ